MEDLQEQTAAVWDGVSEETLAQSLEVTVNRCVQAGLSVDAGSDTADDDGRCGFRLTVSIKSVYRHAIAKVLVMELGRRLPLSQEQRDRMQTALHEALLNAVMHGHLKLAAGLRDTLDGFEISHQTIKKQLDSDACSQCRVVVDLRWTATWVSIAVRDNGIGFDPNKVKGTQRLGSGRGLLIFEAFCDSVDYLNGGTMVVLGFEL